MKAPPNPIEQERELMRMLWHPDVADNPRAFVQLVWPWGKAGTFLADYREPRKWQIEEFERLADHIQRNLKLKLSGREPLLYSRSISSGHGTGKGAFWAMLCHWFRSTRLAATIIDTANTEEQLQTRTWAEGDKWFHAARNKHWFDFRLTSLIVQPDDWFRLELERDNVPCGHFFHRGQLYQPNRPDSFAGIHNAKGVLFGADEASGVPDFVFTTARGFFTEPTLDRYRFMFSQGRHTEGYFYESHQEGSEWDTRQLNALEVEGTDKNYLQGIVDKYGEHSYEARVLVLGLFPNQAEDQFISHALVERAMNREWTQEHEIAAKHEPVIMTVDPSGGGADNAVIAKRRGFDMRFCPFQVLKGLDVTQLSDKIVEVYKGSSPKPCVIVIDSTGLGLGVLSNVKRRIGHVVEVIGVNFGSASDSPAWKDKRTELHALLREWLDSGFLPRDRELKRDLTSPKIERLDSGKQKLQSKRVLKRMGLPSPDKGDAVALSFAVPTVKLRTDRDRDRRPKRARNTDYDAINGFRRAA